MTEQLDNVVPLSSVSHGRVPPQNLDAERSVLGGVLLDNDALDDVVGILKPADFYREAHRKIFEAMLFITQKPVREPIDRVTLKDALVELGTLEQAGGEDFVDLLDKIVPSASNLAYYARIVNGKARTRRLIEAAHHIAAMGYEAQVPVEQLVEEAEARVYAIRDDSSSRKTFQLREAVKGAFKRIESRFETQDEVTGVPSGIFGLDRKTAGWQRGDLILVAARTSMGKSAFALDCARAAARPRKDVEKRTGVVIFSLEMPEDSLVERLIAQEGRVNGQHLRTGRIHENEWPRMGAAGGALSEMKIHIVDDPTATTLDVRAESRRYARRLEQEGAELGLAIVDYLQLLRPMQRRERRELELSEMTRDLKALAKELKIPVIALSQLNRDLEKRPNKRPQLSDIRESGAIEQDSDVVVFLYRDEVYNATTEDKGIAEIIVGKQRNGPVGTVKAAWSEESTTFGNLERDGGPPAQRSFLDEPPPPESENP